VGRPVRLRPIEEAELANLVRRLWAGRRPDYIERRTKEGLTKKEAFRCLKRYIDREVYNSLPQPHLALDSP